MIDQIIADITTEMIAASIPATKYYVPQDRDINDANYIAVTVKPISDTGEYTKDTIGSEDRTYNIRIDIYCRSFSDIDTTHAEVTAVMTSMRDYHIAYDGCVYLRDEETDHYHHVLDYDIRIE